MWAAICIIILVVIPGSSFAQRKGAWTRFPLPITYFVPEEIAFKNADTGVVTGLWNNVGLFEYVTNDAGKSFQRVPNMYFSKSFYRSMFAIPDKGFVFNGGNFSPDGVHWSTHPDPNVNNGRVEFNYPLSPDSSLIGHVLLDGYDFFSLTADTGNTYQDLRGTTPSYQIMDGVARSTRKILLSLNDGSHQEFLARRMDDTGWAYLSPVDTSKWKKAVFLEPIIKGAEEDHYFVLGGRVDSVNDIYGRIDDYYETKDYGNSWRRISGLANGRVVRLANPEKDFLVAMIGHRPYTRLQSIEKNQEWQQSPREKLVDSIFISTDGGATWDKDGQTFAGDTIVDMWWISAKLGYVVTYRDSLTYIYRYEAAPGVVLNHGGHLTRIVDLAVHPDPASTFVTFNNPIDGDFDVSIINALGVTVSSEHRRLPRNQLCRLNLPATLTSGCYSICIRGRYDIFTQSFIRF